MNPELASPYGFTWESQYISSDTTAANNWASVSSSSSSSAASSVSYIRSPSPYIQGDWSEFVVTYDDWLNNLQSFNLDSIGIKEEIPEWDL